MRKVGECMGSTGPLWALSVLQNFGNLDTLISPAMRVPNYGSRASNPWFIKKSIRSKNICPCGRLWTTDSR